MTDETQQAQQTGDDLTTAVLLGWLGAKRRHVRQQVAEMPEEARRRACVPSGWTPLGLVQHLALDVERLWLRRTMGGEELELLDGYDGWRVPADRSTDEVLAAYDEECRLADAAVAGVGLDDPPRWFFDGPGSSPFQTLREVLVHVLVETSTHAGHLDLARELADGGQRLVVQQPD